MDYKDRDGNVVFNNTLQDKFLKKLYTTYLGNIFLKIITLPKVSSFAGVILNSKPSCLLVEPFIKINKVDMNDYPKVKYSSFNNFFTRNIAGEKRLIDLKKDSLISPCDGHVLALKISENSNFIIKSANYSVYSLLKDKKLADQYSDGYCLIFRLSVEDFHRYCYIDDLKKTKNRKIDGLLHTVNPLINGYRDIYKENSREYSLLDTANFGKVVQIEVGALLVGKITNHHEKGEFKKGDEKGLFEFGGSTIVLLFKKDKVKIDKDILINTGEYIETLVKMGEKIGVSI